MNQRRQRVIEQRFQETPDQRPVLLQHLRINTRVRQGLPVDLAQPHIARPDGVQQTEADRQERHHLSRQSIGPPHAGPRLAEIDDVPQTQRLQARPFRGAEFVQGAGAIEQAGPHPPAVPGQVTAHVGQM